MALVASQDTPTNEHFRTTVRELVGGWALKESEPSIHSSIPSTGLPPEGGTGFRCLALYSYFPTEGSTDELAFPKNAEIGEAADQNGEWFLGVYAGAVKLFPSNHVQVL